MGGFGGHCLTVALGCLAAESAAPSSPRPAVIVHVDNRAAVPPDQFVRARAVVEETLEAAGVEVRWTEGRFPLSVMRPDPHVSRALQVALVLVNNSDPATQGAVGCALGFAAPGQAVAYAFYNRVVDATARQPADVAVVLGRVIVHELGHLLLPRGSHARYGIMRADLDLGFTNPNQFTSEQAQAIRDHVALGSAR